MVPETEELNARPHRRPDLLAACCPDTPQKYLGLYDDDAPEDSRAAALRNHLMVRRNYEALVSGDGACAGCGEKSILRAVASVTEAYMRPIYHKKADRLCDKADRLEKDGLAAARRRSRAQRRGAYDLFKRAVAHVVMGLGGENDEDTDRAPRGARRDLRRRRSSTASCAVMRQDAFNHKQPAGHRRPPRQRHVHHVDGRQHRLQHRLRLDPAVQPASLSVDELALPGRRDHHAGCSANR